MTRQQGRAYLLEEYKRQTALFAKRTGQRVSTVRAYLTFKDFQRVVEEA